MITSFNNNENKVYLLLKDDVDGSCVRSRARLHDHMFCDHGITSYYQLTSTFNFQKVCIFKLRLFVNADHSVQFACLLHVT